MLDAKLAAREAIAGLPDGHIKIVAIATETAAALFLAGTYRGASARLTGLTWGAEDLSVELGAEANRDADGRFLDPYRLARALCLAGAAAAQVQAIDTIYVDFRNDDGLRRETRGGAPRRLHRQDGDPSGAGRRSSTRCSRRRAEAIAKAQAIVAAFAAKPGAGAVGIDGVMYDRPHLERAKQLLARASAAMRRRSRALLLAVDRLRIERLVGVAEFERHRAGSCRAAPRDRSTSAGRCGRRRGRPARP